MIDYRIDIVAQPPAVAVVSGFGLSGLGLLPPLLVIGRRWLRGGARRLRWTLPPQHQLNKLFAAQPLHIAEPHLKKEPAKSHLCKRVRPARSQPPRPETIPDQTPTGNYAPIAKAPDIHNNSSSIALSGDPGSGSSINKTCRI